MVITRTAPHPLAPSLEVSDHPLWRVDRVIATPRRPWRALRLLEEPLMNRFGTFAMKAWQNMAPAAYAEIEDPTGHFAALGEAAEAAWVDLWPQLAGPDVPGEATMDKVGRLNNARARAEELVRAEMLIPPAELVLDDDQPDEFAAELLRTQHDAYVTEGLRDPSIDYE